MPYSFIKKPILAISKVIHQPLRVKACWRMRLFDEKNSSYIFLICSNFLSRSTLFSSMSYLSEECNKKLAPISYHLPTKNHNNQSPKKQDFFSPSPNPSWAAGERAGYGPGVHTLYIRSSARHNRSSICLILVPIRRRRVDSRATRPQFFIACLPRPPQDDVSFERTRCPVKLQVSPCRFHSSY